MSGDPPEFMLPGPVADRVRPLRLARTPGNNPATTSTMSPDDCRILARADPNALPVLALDLGTTTGWAHRTSRCVTSGTMNWTERRGETRGDRLWRFWKWMRDTHAATPLSLIAYEMVQHMGDKQRLAAHCWAQFQAVVLTFAACKGIPVVDIHTGTLKKAVTGRGSHPKGTGKDAMIAAVRALGFAPEDHNEADALAVLHWATNLRGKD